MGDLYQRMYKHEASDAFWRVYIWISIGFCGFYAAVFLILGFYKPATIQFLGGALIWSASALFGTKSHVLAEQLTLSFAYAVAVLQVVLYFGGSFGFQYMLMGHIVTVMFLYGEQIFELNRGIYAYLVLTLLFIVYSETMTHGVFVLRASQRLENIFRVTSLAAVVSAIAFFQAWMTRGHKALKRNLFFHETSDAVTGLRNTKVLLEVGEGLFKAQQHFVVMLLDIDYFKTINDTYGHEKGNLVLQGVADHLGVFEGRSSLISRYSGNTFAVILKGVALSEAEARARILKSRIESTPIPIDELRGITVSVSIGIVENGLTQSNFTTILSRADEALYLAKARGRDQIVVLGKVQKTP